MTGCDTRSSSFELSAAPPGKPCGTHSAWWNSAQLIAESMRKRSPFNSVVLLEIAEKDRPGLSYCTGFFISEHGIMTAAHCLFKTGQTKEKEIKNVRFRNGTADKTGSPLFVRSPFRQFAVHPYYSNARPPGGWNSTKTKRADVAILWSWSSGRDKLAYDFGFRLPDGRKVKPTGLDFQTIGYPAPGAKHCAGRMYMSRGKFIRRPGEDDWVGTGLLDHGASGGPVLMNGKVHSVDLGAVPPSSDDPMLRGRFLNPNPLDMTLLTRPLDVAESAIPVYGYRMYNMPDGSPVYRLHTSPSMKTTIWPFAKYFGMAFFAWKTQLPGTNPIYEYTAEYQGGGSRFVTYWYGPPSTRAPVPVNARLHDVKRSEQPIFYLYAARQAFTQPIVQMTGGAHYNDQVQPRLACYFALGFAECNSGATKQFKVFRRATAVIGFASFARRPTYAQYSKWPK